MLKYITVYFLLTNLLYANVGHYKTYSWETDSVLVAWLIKRYVDKNATFSVVSKSQKIEKKYAINTSYSDIRRTSRYTAFETAARIYKVENRCVDKLRPIVRILELAPWRKDDDLRSVNFEKGIVPLFPTKASRQSLKKAFEYIDNYCKDVK